MNIETKFGLFPRDHGGTRYATARRALMQPHRRYHGITHIHRCLSYVEDRFLVDDNINCIESLVDACVFHDIVYDSRPDKEFRSAIAYSCLVNNDRELFGCDKPPHAEWTYMTIKETIDHEFRGKDFYAGSMIRIDLADLSNPEMTARNYELIKLESMGLYKVDEKTFAETNISFMNGLKERVEKNREIDYMRYTDFWTDVLTGIDSTIEMSKAAL